MAEGYCKVEQCADEATAKRRQATLAALGFQAVVASGTALVFTGTVTTDAAGEPVPQGSVSTHSGPWFVLAVATADTLASAD